MSSWWSTSLRAVLYKYIYNATGTPLSYDTDSPDETIVISEYVQNSLQATPVFAYYDGDGEAIATLGPVIDIRYVDVYLVINIDPVRDPGEFMLRSSASLRNLKESL